MTSADIHAGLLIAEGLGATARLAVELRVSERTYLELARALYRRLAGEPKGGRPAQSHGAWDPLLRAVGGQTALAKALRVRRETVMRWVTGRSAPTDGASDRIADLSETLGVESPV